MQHNALVDTCSQLDLIRLEWAHLPADPLRHTLSAQSRNMTVQFWMSLDNRVKIALFKIKQTLAGGFHLNCMLQQALLSDGLRSRRELENLLAKFLKENEQHFRQNAQFTELLEEFRKACSVLDALNAPPNNV